MRPFLRWSGVILVGILMLVAGAVTVLLNIDPNRYKPQIVDLARSRAGLWLRIDGDLHWTLWPRLGLDVRTVTADWQVQPPMPLATFDHLTFDVELLPLLSAHPTLHIGGLRLDGARINLIRHADGTSNWQRPAAQRTSSSASRNTALADIALQRLQIARSVLIYTNELAHTRDELTDLRTSKGFNRW